jgi:hypothetical protein
MKKAKTNREEVRENNLSIPMTKLEKEAVKKAADGCGLTMTSWARMVLAEKINKK